MPQNKNVFLAFPFFAPQNDKKMQNCINFSKNTCVFVGILYNRIRYLLKMDDNEGDTNDYHECV